MFPMAVILFCIINKQKSLSALTTHSVSSLEKLKLP